MLKTDRLILRRFRESDLDDLMTLIRDKMASDYAAYDNQWPVDYNSLKGILDFFTGSDEWFAVELACKSRVIGFVTCGRTENVKQLDLGYTFHSDYRNRGYAYEACRAIMDDLMKNHRIEGFTSGTADANEPSVRLLAKLGFVKSKSFETSFTCDPDGKPITFTGSSYFYKNE